MATSPSLQYRSLRRMTALGLTLAIGCGILPVWAQDASPSPSPVEERTREAIDAQRDVIRSARELDRQVKLYRTSDAKVRDFTEKLRPIEQQIATLSDQLDLMDEQIRITAYKIESVGSELAETENAIARTKVELADAKQKVERQARVLFAYVRLIYAHRKQYYDPESRSLSELKLLLSSESLSTTVGAGQSLEVVERAGRTILDDLERLSAELDAKQAQLLAQQERLSMLRQDLEGERETLLASQSAKEQLLEKTRGDESRFQALIRDAQQQRETAAREVMDLQGDVSFLKNAAAKLRATVSIDLRGLSDKGAEADRALSDAERQELFEWPVPPNRGISAYFIDPGYVEAFGVQHGALDVPTPQGTLIQAPADGVVYKAKDNGFGFSYVILAHRNGFATLYGHVSKILVEEGDVIRRGGVIALSGGAPGTLGAGLRTTGAHLHWEVIKNGKRVDPLRYVELDPIRESIPRSRLPTVQGSLMEGEEQ